MTTIVTTQQELDAAIAADAADIIIDSPQGDWLAVGGSVTVWASGSATVRAWDSATVRAWGSTTVRAWGSTTVWAWDSATVWASGSATVRASDSATVWASSRVAVRLHSGHATVRGGVIIDHTAVDLRDALEWCAHHGVDVRDGIATVYKAVADTWVSGHGTSYAPGTTPEATDWIDNNECGGGLHFSPTPAQASDYCYAPDMRFLACDVAVETLRPIPDETMPKCKAPRVVSPCRPVDIMGRPLDTNGELA